MRLDSPPSQGPQQGVPLGSTRVGSLPDAGRDVLAIRERRIERQPAGDDRGELFGARSATSWYSATAT
jgi:hypothetical protein